MQKRFKSIKVSTLGNYLFIHFVQLGALQKQFCLLTAFWYSTLLFGEPVSKSLKNNLLCNARKVEHAVIQYKKHQILNDLIRCHQTSLMYLAVIPHELPTAILINLLRILDPPMSVPLFSPSRQFLHLHIVISIIKSHFNFPAWNYFIDRQSF